MRTKIFALATIFAALLCGSTARAQGTTTQTTCNVNGQQVNCTSTDNSAQQAAQAQQQADIDASFRQLGDALGTAIARKRYEKNLEGQVSNNLMYCGGHPDARVLGATGKEHTCFDYVEHFHEVCVAQPKYSFCKKIPSMPSASASVVAPSQTARAVTESAPTPAPSPAPAETASTQAAPSQVAPAANSTTSALPKPASTQEEKDALGYCQRNPTATITWNSTDKVSACREVLATIGPAVQ